MRNRADGNERGKLLEEHKNLIKILVTHKSMNINLRNGKGDTFLHLIANSQDVLVAKVLIDQYGAEVNVKDNNGDTPLHMAAKSGCTAMVSILMNRRADLNMKNEKDETPLHLACKNGHVSVAKTLIKKKAEVNIQDNEKNTPLHLYLNYLSLAKRNSDKELIGLLSAARETDVNAKNTDDKTPTGLSVIGATLLIGGIITATPIPQIHAIVVGVMAIVVGLALFCIAAYKTINKPCGTVNDLHYIEQSQLDIT